MAEPSRTCSRALLPLAPSDWIEPDHFDPWRRMPTTLLPLTVHLPIPISSCAPFLFQFAFLAISSRA
jgi:hypothetical protein